MGVNVTMEQFSILLEKINSLQQTAEENRVVLEKNEMILANLQSRQDSNELFTMKFEALEYQNKDLLQRLTKLVIFSPRYFADHRNNRNQP
jgi:hypothetical protein